jgi:hypothetical protein
MLGLSAPGYFARPNKVSRGPWFKEYIAQDDGLEYYYQYSDEDGNTKYLLTNNIPWQDRERLQNLYFGFNRANNLSLFGGLWLGVEAITRVGRLRKTGWGLKLVGGTIIGCAAATAIRYF